MIVKVCSIMDLKVGAYAQPFYAQTIGAALRMFSDHCNEPASMPHKHPSDFAVYHLADFDDETGNFTNIQPTRIANATEFVRRPEDNQLDLTEAIERKKKEKKA